MIQILIHFFTSINGSIDKISKAQTVNTDRTSLSPFTNLVPVEVNSYYYHY